MNDLFLIPANAKKGALIFNIFTMTDLIIFGIGLSISLVLLLTLPIGSLPMAIIALLPGLLSTVLVFPLPYYHNVLRFLRSAFNFLMNRQRYEWKGWCVKDGREDNV